MLRYEGDNIRDYATSAFAKYSRFGCPTREEREQQIRDEIYKRHQNKDPKHVVTLADNEINRRKGQLEDIDAINKMFDMLYDQSHITSVSKGTRNGIDIANAVKAVYFAFGSEKLTRKMITLRVRAHAMSVPVDERTVYRWLKFARELFAVIRGLDVDTENDEIYCY